MRFSSFSEIFEKKISTSPSIEELDVQDKKKGNFSFLEDGVEVSFSIFPLPRNTVGIEDHFRILNDSILEKDAVKLYSALKSMQSLRYHFGNLFSTSLSLSNVEELVTSLTPTQQAAIGLSDELFLQKELSALSSTQKNAILAYLLKLAKRYAVVVEALFFYLKQSEDRKAYDGQNVTDILKEYQKEIDNNFAKVEYKVSSQLSSIEAEKEMTASDDYVYWKVERKKDAKTFVIRATVSPELLNSEDYITTGEKGLNMTILNSDGKVAGQQFTTFPVDQLGSKVDSFLKNN